jgi:CRISPR/Cas system-associated endonuclease Cas1
MEMQFMKYNEAIAEAGVPTISIWTIQIYFTGHKEKRNAIFQCLAKLDEAVELDEVMGIKGMCARYYWDAFRNLLKAPLFTHCEYRPAPDIVNSALNLSCAFF